MKTETLANRTADVVVQSESLANHHEGGGILISTGGKGITRFGLFGFCSVWRGSFRVHDIGGCHIACTNLVFVAFFWGF